MMEFPDTIFALSSGKLPSGVAVVRLSGRGAGGALTRLTGELPLPRKATYSVLRDDDSAIIDRGLSVFFPKPASFTGEDCAELHVHGGRAVVGRLLAMLGSFPDFRLAEAGEFTRRAFLNGKLDLSAAEALSDLITAETEAQRRLAVEAAGGRQRDTYLEWRRRILLVRAEVEAQLDFSDQDDVPRDLPESVAAELAGLVCDMSRHADLFRRSEIIHGGFRVVVLGAPNAGKSSLINALARRDVAIVADEPGTTRDLIEVALDLDGNKVIVTDTAGVRDDAGRVEQIGIDRALAAAGTADLILHLIELGEPVEVPFPFDRPTLRLGSKSDMVPENSGPGVELRVSSKTGAGIAELLDRLAAAATATASHDVAELLPLRERHVLALRRGARHLEKAAALGSNLELAAEELRLASAELGGIVGLVRSEELLGEIFSRFCVGK